MKNILTRNIYLAAFLGLSTGISTVYAGLPPYNNIDNKWTDFTTEITGLIEEAEKLNSLSDKEKSDSRIKIKLFAESIMDVLLATDLTGVPFDEDRGPTDEEFELCVRAVYNARILNGQSVHFKLNLWSTLNSAISKEDLDSLPSWFNAYKPKPHQLNPLGAHRQRIALIYKYFTEFNDTLHTGISDNQLKVFKKRNEMLMVYPETGHIPEKSVDISHITDPFIDKIHGVVLAASKSRHNNWLMKKAQTAPKTAKASNAWVPSATSVNFINNYMQHTPAIRQNQINDWLYAGKQVIQHAIQNQMVNDPNRGSPLDMLDKAKNLDAEIWRNNLTTISKNIIKEEIAEFSITDFHYRIIELFPNGVTSPELQ